MVSCVSPDVMEVSLYGAVLKPCEGDVFVRVCCFLPIWRDLIVMVKFHHIYYFHVCKRSEDLFHEISHSFFNAAYGS